MRYKLLGTTGLRVSEVALGTMTFGDDWGWGADREESRRMWDAFAEAGGTFIDTANLYTNGSSERLVGEFAAADRDQFVIATKYSLTARIRMADSTAVRPNESGNSRKSLVQSVEASLRRLGTDYIDLLYLHAWDYLTPVEEVVRALDDLVRQGKVLYVAASDTPAYIVAEAVTHCRLRGLSPFVAIQVPYHLYRREIERDILPMAQHFGLAVVPWGVLAAGVLTGKFRTQPSEPTRVDATSLSLSPAAEQVVDVVLAVAEETGRSPAQVAFNWVRQQQARAQIIPIVGARRHAQLVDQLAALEWELDATQLSRLEAAAGFEPGFPHDFLPANPFVFGNTYDLIDDHRGERPARPRSN